AVGPTSAHRADRSSRDPRAWSGLRTARPPGTTPLIEHGVGNSPDVRQLVAYAGLATAVRQSGATDRRGHITKHGPAAAPGLHGRGRTLHGAESCRPTDSTCGFLSAQEARERGGQGYLRRGPETPHRRLRHFDEGLRLLVPGGASLPEETQAARGRIILTG